VPSANLEIATATAVEARIFNNWQSCIAVKRFIVAESIAEKMAALKVGEPFEESTELGLLSMPEGVADRDRDVRKTVETGTKILTGGKLLDSRGNFYASTILINIPKDPEGLARLQGRAVRSCSQRPPCQGIDNASRLATTAALVWASAWSNDSVEQERFINELEAGMVFINRMVVF
jgi:succinate-semialdehyde dehydrogenase/glutarate-semialdehyde dehydrogenase